MKSILSIIYEANNLKGVIMAPWKTLTSILLNENGNSVTPTNVLPYPYIRDRVSLQPSTFLLKWMVINTEAQK